MENGLYKITHNTKLWKCEIILDETTDIIKLVMIYQNTKIFEII